MALCVFDIILFYFLIQMDQEAMSAYCSDFLKYVFYYFYGHANFCLCTLYFQCPSALGNFLHHASQLK
jgi:hypothetical protein